MSAHSKKRVYVHGSLAEHFPDSPYEFYCSTAHEAAWALEANFGGFHQLVHDKMVEVVTGDLATGTTIETEEQVHFSIPQDEIHFTLEGSHGAGRAAKAIIGVALFTAAVLLSPYTGGTSYLAYAGSFAVSTMAAVGAGLVLSAIIGPPKANYSDREEADRRQSSILGGPITTVEEGQSVPLVLGGSEGVMSGGVVISASIDAQQVL